MQEIESPDFDVRPRPLFVRSIGKEIVPQVRDDDALRREQPAHVVHDPVAERSVALERALGRVEEAEARDHVVRLLDRPNPRWINEFEHAVVVSGVRLRADIDASHRRTEPDQHLREERRIAVAERVFEDVVFRGSATKIEHLHPLRMRRQRRHGVDLVHVGDVEIDRSPEVVHHVEKQLLDIQELRVMHERRDVLAILDPPEIIEVYFHAESVAWKSSERSLLWARAMVAEWYTRATQNRVPLRD